MSAISAPSSSFVEFCPGELGPACPLCQGHASAEWVRARHVHRQGEWVSFWRCSHCSCLFSTVHENTYAGQLSPGINKFYAELGAGVEPIAQMILESLPAHLRTFADVGCGQGFSLDLVERVLNIPGLGFEPHPSSLVTSDLRGQILPFPLDQEWLSRNTSRFDLILACEVIEHVDDPAGFAGDLRAAMADELSVAVFSTPDAQSITPAEPPSEIFSRLFPGEHRYLFTSDVLRGILLRAGFEAVEVISRGGHLIASAGTASALARRQHLSAPGSRWQDTYHHYLRTALNGAGTELSSPIWMGHSYRLLKALVNGGDIEAARAWRDQRTSLTEWLGDNGLLRPSAVKQALSLPNFESYVARMPSFFGAMAYYLAMLARLEGRGSVAKQGFQQALELIQHEVEIGPFCFIESCALLAPSQMEMALVTFSLGHQEEAFEYWQRMDQSLPHMASFARAGARLLLEANARGNYTMVARILDDLSRHPLRSHGLTQALCSGVLEGCDQADQDLVFNVWIARFHAALHTHQPVAKIEETYVMLSIQAGANPERQSKLEAVRQDLIERQTQERLAARQAPVLVHLVDQLWCDLHGVFVKGWVHAGDHEIRAVHLSCNGRREQASLHSRPDVTAFYPQYPRSGNGGFSAYLACAPFQPVELHVDIGQPTPLKIPLQVPPHLMGQNASMAEQCRDVFRDLMKRQGGTVVVLGGRMGPNHPDNWADCLLPECEIVRMDIHPGPGVDIVGDVHALSEHIAPNSVNAVISAYVMEHLEAPWVVAAEINKVLRPGGLTMHYVPHAWPLHAAPNDFWRMSDAGLQALYGKATGFEVLEAGMGGPVRMHPPPEIRTTQYASIEMPVFDGYLFAYLLARKVADLPDGTVRWPGTAADRSARAQSYPTN